MNPYSLFNNVIFLDIETTGLDPFKDKIIEIGAVKIKDKKVTRFSSLVNPKMKVPLNIIDLCTGITQEELDNAPEQTIVMEELMIFIENLPLVCHNAAFEKSFLSITNEFLDSLELIAILFPELHEYNLQYLINKFLPKNRVEIHRGLSDSEDTNEVINYAISDFFYENGFTLPMSITELERWNWYKYLSSVNMDDIKYFIDNRPIEPKKIEEPYPVFGLKDYEKLFEQKDIWVRNGRSYKLRPQQRDASRFIREGLEKGKFTLMEAPTGLGKSMAYLLPASIFSYLNEQKVIISTNTKGLQNQLVEKDIPNLLDSLNLKNDANYLLIKGKSNYLCFDRFQDIEYPKDMNNLLGYVYLKRLITERGLGDIEDISLSIREKFNLNELLEQCFCDSEICDVDACSYRDSCYYASKVEALKEAQVIVVNHSLLLKWPYRNAVQLENIVVDEAHNLIQEAYDAFESTLISTEFERLLNEIYNGREKSGFLYYLSLRARNKTLPLSDIESGMEKCKAQMINIKYAFENYIESTGISREYNIKEHINKNNFKLSQAIKQLEYFKEDLCGLNLSIDKAVNILKDITSIEKDKRLKILTEKVEVINSYISLLEDVFTQSKEDYCYYFEVEKRYKWWKISSIPLDVSSDFYERVLNGAKSCLFISATLSTDRGYTNLKSTLGINIGKAQNKEIIEVPPIEPVFDYKRKSVVYAFENLDPNDVGAFSEDLNNFVVELLDNVDGNIIMLFTSRKRLEAFKFKALNSLYALGIRVIEGKKGVQKLKSRKERYIFLGSKGYFEGIDIPGDSMTTVILDKLPNINSKEPFYKSLVEKDMERSKSYWQSYANINFPIVSIDLKQIYGRIIRTEYDYGSLFIMSKFDKSNSTVRKLESQLHGVPIIRGEKAKIFGDLRERTLRWKQINLFKIMKEVKSPLKKAIEEQKKLNGIKSIYEIKDFVNSFFALEYGKRNLKYDVEVTFSEELSIKISGHLLDLGRNKSNIKQYFMDII